MQVTVPAEFEAFAREMVAAGTYASPEEAVASALHEHLAQVAELRALLEEGEKDCSIEGEAMFERMLDELQQRASKA